MRHGILKHAPSTLAPGRSFRLPQHLCPNWHPRSPCIWLQLPPSLPAHTSPRAYEVTPAWIALSCQDLEASQTLRYLTLPRQPRKEVLGLTHAKLQGRPPKLRALSFSLARCCAT